MMETTYTLGAALRLTLETHAARFGLTPEDLFQVAVRQNHKRPFLFVSKVLGKHLPVAPATLLSAGRLLALAWTGNAGWETWTGVVKGEGRPPFPALMDQLDQTRIPLDRPTLFVGFAETATGLARAVADSFSGDLRYVASTRVTLPGPEPLAFDEAHSHARNHLLHLDPNDPFWKRCQRVVLVDDELTTARTALRLVEQLHGAFGVREFVLLTLLDNSGAEERQALERRLGIEISVVSLLQGRILQVDTGPLPDPIPLREPPAGAETPVHPLPPLADDRRPRSAQELEQQRIQAKTCASQIRSGAGDLFLGTGEFIYFPALVAGYRGSTAYHASTQSPVLPLAGSAIVSGGRFPPVETYSAAGYLYDIPKGGHARAAVFVQRDWMRPEGLEGLVVHLKDRGIGEVEVCAV